MTMKHGCQIRIAQKCSISQGFLSDIISNKRRPSWKTAKRLAKETNTSPELWLDGSTAEIQGALFGYKIESKPKKSKFRNLFKKWSLF